MDAGRSPALPSPADPRDRPSARRRRQPRWRRKAESPYHGPVDLIEAWDTGKHHPHLELAKQDLDDSSHAVGAARRETVTVGPANEDGTGSECDRLQDVRAPPDSSVHEHGGTAGNPIDDRGQRVDRRRNGIEISRPVIRHDDPMRSLTHADLRVLRIENALEQERYFRKRKNPTDVLPGNRRQGRID